MVTARSINFCTSLSYVTLSAKNSLILGENKAAFCREGHIYITVSILCFYYYIEFGNQYSYKIIMSNLSYKKLTQIMKKK